MMYLIGDMAKSVSENLPLSKDDYFWEDIVYNLIDKHFICLTKIPNIVFEIDSIRDALIENILSNNEIIDLCEGDEKIISAVNEILRG